GQLGRAPKYRVSPIGVETCVAAAAGGANAYSRAAGRRGAGTLVDVGGRAATRRDRGRSSRLRSRGPGPAKHFASCDLGRDDGVRPAAVRHRTGGGLQVRV